jgi:hypothetical protein
LASFVYVQQAGVTAMTLRKSEAVLRLLVGLALGFGFVGFATHSRAEGEQRHQVSEPQTVETAPHVPA